MRETARLHRHSPTDVAGKWLKRVLNGLLNVHAMSGNLAHLQVFRQEVGKL
ncbi:hypothetical protein [Rubripirellula lacrimiformis]|uniref:hypothetical protein n=1 Tax=Rubripirellula lacrimiformis TaxID=1930273 RepID=UPI001C54D2F4|nr:hypothetical protein [Rubripirellula lacrimiformis]